VQSALISGGRFAIDQWHSDPFHRPRRPQHLHAIRGAISAHQRHSDPFHRPRRPRHLSRLDVVVVRQAVRGRGHVPGRRARCDEHLHARQVISGNQWPCATPAVTAAACPEVAISGNQWQSVSMYQAGGNCGGAPGGGLGSDCTGGVLPRGRGDAKRPCVFTPVCSHRGRGDAKRPCGRSSGWPCGGGSASGGGSAFMPPPCRALSRPLPLALA
jgi:hypothetical protein